MILRQKFSDSERARDQWSSTPVSYYDWSIDGVKGHDSRGTYVRIGSWSANFWFHVAQGKTDKLTLSYAKKYLRAHTKIPCTFEYVEEL